MQSFDRATFAAGCLLAAAGIALGAFAAHGLRDVLGAAEMGWWQIAVQYQMWQAIGLVVLSFARLPGIRLAAWLLAAGAILFSASLYVMALTGWRQLGMVTPIGGLLMLAGWLLAGWSAFRAGDD